MRTVHIGAVVDFEDMHDAQVRISPVDEDDGWAQADLARELGLSRQSTQKVMSMQMASPR